MPPRTDPTNSQLARAGSDAVPHTEVCLKINMDTSDFYSHLPVITKYNNYAQKNIISGATEANSQSRDHSLPLLKIYSVKGNKNI